MGLGDIARPAGEDARRSPSAARSRLQPGVILRGRVLAVNTANFTVDVGSESHPYSLFLDIPFSVPYCHQNQGEGINFMPEVAATCWICQPSEEGRFPFVIGFTMVDENSTYRGGRELLNPGDIHFSTRDGNFLYIRRGGIVQVGATPVCQSIYIPLRNLIRHISENYDIQTVGGELQWMVNRTDEQGDGHRGTLFQLDCKEYADDPNDDPLATLKIGSHGDGDDTILTLQTRDSGGGDIKTVLKTDKSGNITWVMEQNFTQTLKQGDYSLDVQGGAVSVSSKKAYSVTSQDSLTLKSSKAASIKTDDAMSLSSSKGMTFKGQTINIHDALYPVMRWSPDMQAWMQAVTTAIGTPMTGPAAGAATANPAIQSLSPKQHTNKKVNV